MNKPEFKLPPHEYEHVVTTLSQKKGWEITQNNIPSTWKYTQGEDQVVMVIDTGLPNHRDLGDNIIVEKSKNFSSSNTVADKEGHGCVSPDTYIHTNFCGIEKIKTLYDRIPIEEEYSNDFNGYIKDVSGLGIKTYSLNQKTSNCEISKVKLIHRTPVDSDIIKFKLEGNIEYKLTPWHPVYTYITKAHKKFDIIKKRADELCETDRLIFNNGINSGKLVSEYYRVNGELLRYCDNCGYKSRIKKQLLKSWKCKKCHKQEFSEKNETYFLTEEFAYLIGIIITDGHIHNPQKNKYRIEITSITMEILEKSKYYLDKLGFKTSYIREENDKCPRLIIDSKELHTILMNSGVLYKDKTYSQKLPEFVGKSPYSVICAFLAGVIDGDGCISNATCKNRITSASENFANELVILFNSIGISSGVSKGVSSKYNGTFVRKDGENILIYNCLFSSLPIDIIDYMNHPKRKERALYQYKKNINKYKARKIREICKEHYNGFFYDFTIEDNHTYLANGHFVSNTHCSGSICAKNNGFGMVGVAPKAKVIAVKALGDNGSGSFKAIEKALEYAVEVKPNVVSMSLGATSSTPKIHKLIKKLYEMNIPVVCAAGNEAEAGVNYPAKYPETIAVGAYDKHGKIANFSAIGEEVDFAAPGVGIYSTYLNNRYATLNGSSMACPFISGVVALLLAKHKKQEKEEGKNDCKTVDEIKQHLLKYTVDKGYVGKDKYWGYGIVDVDKMLLASLDPNLDLPIYTEPKENAITKFLNWIMKLLNKK